MESWMTQLGQYAFDIHSEKPQKETDEDFDIHLSILFKNMGNGQYEFIHQIILWVFFSEAFCKYAG